jgi:hypothetical protein
VRTFTLVLAGGLPARRAAAPRRCRRLRLGALLLAWAPSAAHAQAFTLPQGIGGATLAFQYYDDTGRRFTDASRASVGQTETVTAFLELDYGVTDRLSTTLSLPYVFARYRGEKPPDPIPYQSFDECHCWNSTFQDFAVTSRYRLGDDRWAVTPIVRYILPSHGYNYQGEAVAGFHRKELALGLGAAWRVTGLEPTPAILQVGYAYSFVEKFQDIPNDRSNGSIELGYSASRRLYLHANGIFQYTHGGLRFGSPSGVPYPPPGEVGAVLDTNEKLEDFHRLLRNDYWQVGGGFSYSAGPFDVFASFTKFVWGTDTHDGQAYTVGVTWYFGGAR